MNKKIRQDLTNLKYKKRIRLFVANCTSYINRDGQRIHNPKTTDVIKDQGQLVYKTTSTPCSCEMCSGAYKYKRHIQRAIDQQMIQEGLEEYLEG